MLLGNVGDSVPRFCRIVLWLRSRPAIINGSCSATRTRYGDTATHRWTDMVSQYLGTTWVGFQDWIFWTSTFTSFKRYTVMGPLMTDQNRTYIAHQLRKQLFLKCITTHSSEWMSSTCMVPPWVCSWKNWVYRGEQHLFGQKSFCLRTSTHRLLQQFAIRQVPNYQKGLLQKTKQKHGSAAARRLLVVKHSWTTGPKIVWFAPRISEAKKCTGMVPSTVGLRFVYCDEIIPRRLQTHENLCSSCA